MKHEFRLGAIIALIIILMSLLSFFWVPYDYNAMNHENRFTSPNFKNILGTDNFGRDIFSRIMAGGRNSLLIAFSTVAGALAIGTILGGFAGYLGGITEKIIMRIIDTLNSFPGILLALFMIAAMDNSRHGLFAALLILFIPSYTRIMRTGTMRYKNETFIQAEKTLGASNFRIIFIHILPNLAPSLLSASVLGLSNAILAEASMSYLGLGIQPPEPSWGRMLYEAQTYFLTAPFYALAPGLFIMLTVIAFHLLGEGLKKNWSTN